MPIYYDVEIPGGLPAAGTVYAEDGYIDGFDLPDETHVSVDRAGFLSTKPTHLAIAKMVWREILNSEGIKLQVAQTRPYVRPDVAPVYL